jgi:ubiquinone/menaquinone biosynthesis C-methylase UbiE
MEFETTNVKNVYEIIANDFSDKRFNKWDWIEEYLENLTSNNIILDIGCGNGRNMMNKKHTFIGVDNCTNFVNIACKRNLNVVLSDMTALPFIDNMFDNIIMIASFHHLSTIERRLKCLEEINRILKKNGTILLSVWSINQSHNRRLNNVFHYGDNFVPWKDGKNNVKGNRYYYIFKMDELYELFSIHFLIVKYFLDHGNEVFVLQKK